MPRAYYNEHDSFAAAWLRELIIAGLIADGDVDERSIEDVTPADLAGYTQVHFFAGIGGWSAALRAAGWPDDRPVWTGSPPCQPFSSAGKGAGFDDERHLWPAMHWLVAQCAPDIVFGEQVASKDGLAWVDLVSADLEGSGYAGWFFDLCAAGVGAPHIRQRLYWGGIRLGHGFGAGLEGHAGHGDDQTGRTLATGPASTTGESSWLADNNEVGLQRGRGPGAAGEPEPSDIGAGSRGLADATVLVACESRPESGGHVGLLTSDGSTLREAGGGAQSEPAPELGRPGPTNGFWGAADWLHCRDAKWRPVGPGAFPLANGPSARVGRLRGYGNAICVPLATEVIKSVMEAL